MTGGDPMAWSPLTRDGDMLWLKYSFGPGTANALAVPLEDRSWAVISPPRDAPESVYHVIERQGGVSALIAPNGFHNMGQKEWRARFPNARSYAPRGALARLSSKSPGIPYQPIEENAGKLAPARMFIPDGMKTPDVFFRMASPGGDVWWLGDQFSNNTASDQIFLLRLVSRLVGSGLGYRCNARPELVYVRDRAAWLSSMRAALLEAPPAIVLAAHGDPVTDNTAARTLHALDAVAARSRKPWLATMAERGT